MTKTSTISQRQGGKFYIQLDVILFKEDDIWVAYAPALDLSSYGDDEKDAEKAFSQALKIFISETTRKGTLEKVLLKLGWKLQQKPTVKYTMPIMRADVKRKFIRTNSHFVKHPVEIPV